MKLKNSPDENGIIIKNRLEMIRTKGNTKIKIMRRVKVNKELLAENSLRDEMVDMAVSCNKDLKNWIEDKPFNIVLAHIHPTYRDEYRLKLRNLTK